MLNDEVINKVVDRVVRRIEQGNTYVLKKMGESIAKIRTLTPSQAQQLAQIMRYGGDYDKIVQELARISKLNIKDIYSIFEEVAKNDYRFAGQFYKYRNKKYIPYKYNKALQDQVNAIANITAKKYINITNSMGFVIRKNGRKTYTRLARVYEELLDKAVLSVSQGKTTFDEEMYSAIKELASSGLKTVDYTLDGKVRHYRVDSAVRMAMQDGLRQLHNETQQIFGEQFNADGIEISVHNNPAPDHMYVQGKQFSIDHYDETGEFIKGEFEKFQNDEGSYSYDGTFFPAESEETGHDRRSISQYNCYHYVFSIVLGVSKPSYSDKELKEIIDKNEKGFEYENKHYTLYEGEQLMRKLELELRKAKDTQIMARASGIREDAIDSQKRINSLTQKYNEVLKTSGLPSQIQRAKVSGYRKISVK